MLADQSGRDPATKLTVPDKRNQQVLPPTDEPSLSDSFLITIVVEVGNMHKASEEYIGSCNGDGRLLPT